MKSVLITGTESGLGLGMVKYLIKNKCAENIFATYLVQTEEIMKIGQENKNVHVIPLDVTDCSQYDRVVSKVSEVVGDQGLNLLMNNAGTQSEFYKIDKVTVQDLIINHKVNTIGPIMLTKAFLPLLRQAAKVNSEKPVGVERAAVVNTSSKMASISENKSGGFYPYRCSKAALNAASKSMSIDLKEDNILVISLHPGWVQTFMGGVGAVLDVDTSINGIFNTITNLKEEDSGKFFEYNGKEVPW